MQLKTKGTPHLINSPIVARVTRNANNTNNDTVLLSDTKTFIKHDSSFKAILTNSPFQEHAIDIPSVYSVGTFDHLVDGDIVLINPDGIINTLYRVKSYQNFILATERCNSNCLMCSQPPKDRDDTKYLFNAHSQLIPLIPKNCLELGITGGEPTLMGEDFFVLLEQLKKELPDTEIHCLTNGRSFAWKNVASRLSRINYNRLMLGIPLYSDYYQQHDYIVQAKNAFHQTMQGLYNLASFEQRIEIRIVLHKQTIPRLTRLARFIYRNLPFVEHVAFMGLENQGYTPHNKQHLWIDPVEYVNELSESIEFLSSAGMNVSIYNSQLCLLPKTLWQFNKKSISDWKNIYLESCQECQLIEECGGLFASCGTLHSKHIKAFS